MPPCNLWFHLKKTFKRLWIIDGCVSEALTAKLVSNYLMRLSMISWIIKTEIWVVYWSQKRGRSRRHRLKVSWIVIFSNFVIRNTNNCKNNNKWVGLLVLKESSKLKKISLLSTIFSKVTLTLAFCSTPSESRFTCTVVRPLGIVAIGIRAARVWPCDTLIDVYKYKANEELTKTYRKF